MIVGLLSIFGTYGLAIAMVHLGRSRFNWSRRKPIHYILMTRNNELHIEWYLRSLLFVSRLKARAVHIVVWDDDSEDDTLAIAERLAAARPNHIEIADWRAASQLEERIEQYENEEVVLVRLGNEKDMQNIPLFQ